MRNALSVVQAGCVLAEANLTLAGTVLVAVALAALSITCAVLVVAFERTCDSIDDQENER